MTFRCLVVDGWPFGCVAGVSSPGNQWSYGHPLITGWGIHLVGFRLKTNPHLFGESLAKQASGHG